MMKLLNNIFIQIRDILDILHADIYSLKRNPKTDIIMCTVLSTRVKIYNIGHQIIKLLKNKKYEEAVELNVRMIRLININRNQIYKMAKGKKYVVDLSNLRFLCDLKKLFKMITT